MKKLAILLCLLLCGTAHADTWWHKAYVSGPSVTGTDVWAERINNENILRIQPYAYDDVRVFDETDVGDDIDGKSFYIYRKAAEGDSYLQMFGNDDKNPMIISSTGALTFYETTNQTFQPRFHNALGNGRVVFEVMANDCWFDMRAYGTIYGETLFGSSVQDGVVIMARNASAGMFIGSYENFDVIFGTNNIERVRIANDGEITFTETISGPTVTATTVFFDGLPTSDPLKSGQIWSNNGVLTISNP